MALCAPTTAALLVLLQGSLAQSPPEPPGRLPSAAPSHLATGGSSAEALAPATDLVALVAQLSRAARVVGTPSYARGLEAVEGALLDAGLAPARVEVEVTRAIPTRSDVLLFEDGVAELAFAGLKERWDPAAAPAAPLPAAYAWNPSTASARGPVVELGAGLEADFAEAGRMRLPLEGAVALVTVPAAPSNRKTSVRAIAERAASRGCIGVLIAPLRPGTNRDDFVMADIRPAPGEGPGELRLPVPCAPVRSVEAEMLRTRLKVRRIRGADGKATTLRVGPGPVEASLNIECPLGTVRAAALRLAVPTAEADVVHLISMDHRPTLALGGAPAVAVAVGVAEALGRPGDGPAAGRGTAHLWFGPRFGRLPDDLGAPGLLLDAVLAPRPGVPLLMRHGRLGPSRLTPRLAEFNGQLADRLAGQLEPRLAAATEWLTYSIAGTDEPRRPMGARASRGLERLLAPLPSER